MKKPLSTRIVTRTAAALACAVCAVGLMTGCSQGSKADSASEASASATRRRRRVISHRTSTRRAKAVSRKA